MTQLLNMLRGIGGEFEINRVLGAAGVTAYIICVPIFVGYQVFALGKEFDVVAFCAAYPTGLGVAIGAIAGSVALKDRNVAVAQVTRETGSAPGNGTVTVQNVEKVDVRAEPDA